MKVIVIAKEPFAVIQYANVTNIALTAGNYVLTVGIATYTYAKSSYSLMII